MVVGWPFRVWPWRFGWWPWVVGGSWWWVACVFVLWGVWRWVCVWGRGLACGWVAFSRLVFGLGGGCGLVGWWLGLALWSGFLGGVGWVWVCWSCGSVRCGAMFSFFVLLHVAINVALNKILDIQKFPENEV